MLRLRSARTDRQALVGWGSSLRHRCRLSPTRPTGLPPCLPDQGASTARSRLGSRRGHAADRTKSPHDLYGIPASIRAPTVASFQRHGPTSNQVPLRCQKGGPFASFMPTPISSRSVLGRPRRSRPRDYESLSHVGAQGISELRGREAGRFVEASVAAFGDSQPCSLGSRRARCPRCRARPAGRVPRVKQPCVCTHRQARLKGGRPVQKKHLPRMEEGTGSRRRAQPRASKSRRPYRCLRGHQVASNELVALDNTLDDDRAAAAFLVASPRVRFNAFKPTAMLFGHGH